MDQTMEITRVFLYADKIIQFEIGHAIRDTPYYSILPLPYLALRNFSEVGFRSTSSTESQTPQIPAKVFARKEAAQLLPRATMRL